MTLLALWRLHRQLRSSKQRRLGTHSGSCRCNMAHWETASQDQERWRRSRLRVRMTTLCFASTFSLICLKRHLQELPHDAMRIQRFNATLHAYSYFWVELAG